MALLLFGSKIHVPVLVGAIYRRWLWSLALALALPLDFASKLPNVWSRGMVARSRRARGRELAAPRAPPAPPRAAAYPKLILPFSARHLISDEASRIVFRSSC